jgi:hypothetical protein
MVVDDASADVAPTIVAAFVKQTPSQVVPAGGHHPLDFPAAALLRSLRFGTAGAGDRYCHIGRASARGCG